MVLADFQVRVLEEAQRNPLDRIAVPWCMNTQLAEVLALRSLALFRASITACA
jgi:hypothetical protein